MKTHKTFKPFELLSGIFSLLLISFIVATFAGFSTIVVAAVMFVVASLFVKTHKGFAYGVLGASIADMSQLQIKQFITAAIMNHYGYVQISTGGWDKTKNSREVPAFTDEA